MLSSKINGDSRNLRHIANILYDRMNEREQTEDYVGIENKIYRRPLDFYGAQGYDWKVSLIETERHILKELGFRLSVELPQKFVLIFVNTLRDKSDAPNWTQGGLHPYQKVLQTAWNYANDVLYSKLCVLEQPHAIACACISLGASQCELELPENWHVVFGCTAENCKSIADEITSIYATPDTRGKFVDYSNCDVFRQFSSKKKSADQANGSAGDIEEICVRSGKRKRRRSSFENDSE